MSSGDTVENPAGDEHRGRRSSFASNQAKGPPTARTISQEALAERKRLEQRFQHEQRAKDNAQRRLFANVAAGLFVVLLVGSFLVAAFSSESDTRSQAWDLVTLLVGGVVAAIAGYLAGRAGNER